jgi:hypothetical protein
MRRNTFPERQFPSAPGTTIAGPPPHHHLQRDTKAENLARAALIRLSMRPEAVSGRKIIEKYQAEKSIDKAGAT